MGTPMQFTAASLNSGYFAMAEKLDLCDIAERRHEDGRHRAVTAMPIDMDSPVLRHRLEQRLADRDGRAYATVANNGIYCQPQAIDRVTDSDGNEIAPPQTACTQVLDPKVAATAAFALQGVMAAAEPVRQGTRATARRSSARPARTRSSRRG